MGGSSVWYHVIRGAKVFWLAPPTARNLRAYSEWIRDRDQASTWFGDRVGADQVSRLTLEPGMTLSLPSAWLHAVEGGAARPRRAAASGAEGCACVANGHRIVRPPPQVYTPEDSLVVGGNYLHTAAWPTQAAVFDLEKARGGVLGSRL